MGENSTTLQAGDVVRLKSGGPEMTIKHINEANQAVCNWFEGLKGPYTEVFELVQLEKETKEGNGLMFL